MSDSYVTFPREYWTAYAVRVTDQGQREGQAAFNAVYELWPNVADSLRGTSYDPFYDDSRKDAFLDIVLERLTNPSK